MSDLKILFHMIENADHVAPWLIGELSDSLSIKQGTVYHSTRKLIGAGLVRRVPGGLVLTQTVLNAGAKFAGQINTADLQKLQEKIYG